MQPLILAALPLLGVLIGAGLQFLAGRALEERRQLSQLRASAYADYFKATAAIASQGRTKEHLGALADAKCRVCLYGTPHVVRVLADLERAGADLGAVEGRSAMLRFIMEARIETARHSTALSLDDLEAVLFKAQNK